MANTVYNPDDAVQTSFLSALALGETGNNPNSATEGYGGVSLAGAATDQYGFPLQASGANVSSAAGTFQFLHGTYDEVAGSLGLTDFSQSSQNEAAWYYAEQTYNKSTGGDLYTALQNGDYSSVQTALSKVWPSVLGNGAAPGGLAASLAGGQGANIPFPALPAARLDHQRRLLEARKASSGTLKTGSNASASLPSAGLS